MLKSYISTLSNFIILTCQKIIALLFIIKKIVHHCKSLILWRYFLILRIGVESKIFTKFFCKILVITDNADHCMIFIFVNGYKSTNRMISIFLFDSWLNNLPTQLTRSTSTFNINRSLLFFEISDHTEVSVTVEDAFLFSCSIFQSDSNWIF